jgi:hypothetical protein
MEEAYHSAHGDKQSPFPDELKSLDQFVVWKTITRGDKPTKVPFQPHYPSKPARTNTRATWGTYETAVDVARRNPTMSGIGFVFSAEDPFCGVDFDDCIDEAGNIDPWVVGWLYRLRGYYEVSPSGRGIKVWVSAKLPGKGCNETVDGHAVEMYDRGRFFAITHETLEGASTPSDAQEAVSELYSRLSEVAKTRKPKVSTHPTGEAGTKTSYHFDAPIPDGQRNSTLVSICGRWHDGTRTAEELFADLMDINNRCCQPPLDADEVRSIAFRMHQKEPCAPGSATPRCLEVINYLQDVANRRPVRGKAGATGWSIYNAILDKARKVGRLHKRGVELSVDYRTIALDAGVGSTTTVSAFIRRTPLTEVLEKGSGRRATRLLVVNSTPPKEGVESVHSNPVECKAAVTGMRSEQFRPLFRTLYRLRWSKPSWKPGKKTREAYRKGKISCLSDPREGVERIGKSRAAILAVLLLAGPQMSRADIAGTLGRSPDSLKKPLKWLVDVGLVFRVYRGVYEVSDELTERLAELRVLGREDEDNRLQMARNARQRKAWRTRNSHEAHNFTEDQMHSRQDHPTPPPPPDPGPDPEPEEKPTDEERIRRLVYEGMSERWARAEVLGEALL